MNSSLIKRGRSLMDSQLHPLLHFLVRMTPTSKIVFLQVAINVKVARGKIWTERRMLKCFPAKSRLSLTRLAVWGRSLSCKRLITSNSIPGRFDFMARRTTFSHQETNHACLLFFACLHFQCWMNTLHTYSHH